MSKIMQLTCREQKVLLLETKMTYFQVKFSVFNVDLFTVMSRDSDKICDNRWHSLEATLIRNVVKLVVDGGDPQYGSSENTARNVTTSSALYVGGVPGK